jgi:hypothetical protein
VAECYARLILARVLIATEGAQAAGAIQEALMRAFVLVEETGAPSMEPSIHVELAELARLKGDEAGRQRELLEAQRLFSSIGAPLRAEQVAKEVAL